MSGWSLNNLSRYQEALQDFDKVLQIDPNDTEALGSKGYALDNLGS
jgi:Flp pilus assembly protein TadD